MKTNLLAAAAAVAIALAGSPASAHDDVEHAILACEDMNDFPPLVLIDAEYDEGWDLFVIWLEDADGDVWRCTTDGYGEVYENEIIYTV